MTSFESGILSTVLAPATAANPFTTCSAGYAYAGYYHSGIPGSGNSISADITWNTTTLHSGHVAGWIDADDGSSTAWIQPGIYREFGGNGLRLYIEYNDGSGAVRTDEGSATAGVAYSATVTKVSSGVWDASIDGNDLGNTSISGLSETGWYGESYLNPGGTCNVMDVNFSSTSIGTSSMTGNVQNSPYVISSVTSNGWRSHGS